MKKKKKIAVAMEIVNSSNTKTKQKCILSFLF